MTCTQCGYEVTDGATTCPVCSQPLSNSQPEQQPPMQSEQQPSVQQQPPMQQPQQPNYSYPNQPQYGPGYPPAKARTAPLILGIVSIVFAFIIPLVSLICSLVGLSMANADIKKGLTTQKYMKIINIVALVLTIISFIFNIIMAVGLVASLY